MIYLQNLIKILKKNNWEVKVYFDNVLEIKKLYKYKEITNFFNLFIHFNIKNIQSLDDLKYLDDLIIFIPKYPEEFSILEEGSYDSNDYFYSLDIKGYNHHIWANSSYKLKYLFNYYKINKSFSKHSLCYINKNIDDFLNFLKKMYKIDQLTIDYTNKDYCFLEKTIVLILEEYINQYLYWKINNKWLWAFDEKNYKYEKNFNEKNILQKISNK